MSNSTEGQLERPTEPGSPWAPPHPLTHGPEPTLLMPNTAADSLLNLAAPEGMVRLSKGDQTEFCFPCHIDGWMALGWQAHLPSLVPTDDGPLLPPSAPGMAVIEQNHNDRPLVEPGQPVPDQVLCDEPQLDEQLPDYGAMTKAQIIAEVERRYGLALDGGMTKAELVAEAERLAVDRLTAERLTAGGLPAEAEPDSQDDHPALPLDLLG